MNKQEPRFWKMVALAALMLAGWAVVRTAGTPAHADNGGATTAGLIALVGNNPANEHVFLIDTNNSTISMYESKNNTGLNLVAGRAFDQDSMLIRQTSGRELPYRSDNKGYTPVDVAKMLNEIAAQSKKGK